MNHTSSDVYRSIFDGTTEALAVLGKNGRLLLANRAARVLGVDIERLPLSGGGFRTMTLSLVDRAGAERVLSVDERPLDEERVLLVLRDITRQTAADEGPPQRAGIESIGYLTATVVHDFNNLLVPILCTSSLLERELAFEPLLEAMAAEVRMASERGAELVRGLMNLVRRQTPAAERVDVNAVLVEMMPLLRRGLPENVDLALALHGSALEVVVDRHRLEVALLNLVANARDAMPDGGRILVTTARHGADERWPSAPAGHASIVVADNGQGMDESVRQRAFERFFTTKAEGRGTGLGLPAVQYFVTDYGGRIALESELGRGTTVTLSLPLAAHVEDEPTSSRKNAELPAGSETILVVEDDEAVRYAVRSVLERYGYSVVDAKSGVEALRVLDEERTVDLAIVDAVMRNMSGRDLVRRLRAEGYRAKVLYMSGHLDAAVNAHATFGQERVLRKAFSPSELLRNVRRALDGP
ncbi:MAG TPA: ATP-binding protein [Polyangiaceae bacterium]|nr:ATP-binding protein [Polyangiaceae bacterium]